MVKTMQKINGVTKKVILIGSVAAGAGVAIYTIKRRQRKNDHPATNVIKKELMEFLEAEYIFDSIILNDDINIEINNETYTSDFKAIEYAKKFYLRSTEFKTAEIRKIAKDWYLNKLNVIGFYINATDETTLKNSYISIIKSKNALENLISTKNINKDDLVNEKIEELYKNNSEKMKEEQLNNNLLIRYMYK